MQIEAAPLAPEPPRWHRIVELLNSKEERSNDQVLSMLNEALDAASADNHWASSGLVDLLGRAREAAQHGFTESAKKAAVGLLDFHNVVQRYRDGGSSGGKKSNPGTSGTSSEDDGNEDPCFRRMGTDDSDKSEHGMHHLAAAAAADADSAFPAAASGERKRRRSIAEHIPTEDAERAAAAALLRGGPQATWAGQVKLQRGDLMIDMCSVEMRVPAGVLDELPRELRVQSLSQRSAVRISGQLACETVVTAATRTQLGQLKKMAQMELVAVIELADCGAILVPYLARGDQVKVVTFLVAFDL